MNKATYTDMLADFGIGSAHPGGINLTKSIFQNVNIKEEMSILDLGCGTGQTAAFLANKYKCQVTAVDNHNTMIEKAQKRFKNENLNIHLINTNIESLPFQAEQFDFIISESVLTFTNINNSLQEINRVLKPNGRLIAIEMTAEDELTSEEKLEINSVYNIKNVFLEEQWQQTLVKTGFTLVNLFADNKTPSDRVMTENEHDPSPFINPELFNILEAHGHLMKKYQKKLSYRIIDCKK